VSEPVLETDPAGYVYSIGTEAEGLQWVGRESEPVEQPYPVDVEHIEHFAEGIQDPNPLYWSEEFGRQTRWGGRIAPWGVIVLTGEQLRGLAEARRIARQALAILRQNQRWALVYNLSVIPLGALGFIPPWLAALGMSTSSLVVVLNALRIGRHADSRGAAPALHAQAAT